MPQSSDQVIFVLTDDRRQTEPITLPLAHMHGVYANICCASEGSLYSKGHRLCKQHMHIAAHAHYLVTSCLHTWPKL